MTISLGELIMKVYEQYGERNAEALIWFALHGYLIVSPSSDAKPSPSTSP